MGFGCLYTSILVLLYLQAAEMQGAALKMMPPIL